MAADNTQKLIAKHKVLKGPRGVRLRRNPTQSERDSKTLVQIERLLLDHSVGKTDMTPTQVMAARALLDKLRPSLQAVEQTVHDERDKLTDSDIITALESMLNASPGIAETLAQLCVKADPAILPRLSVPPEQPH